jgi:hypothetical protein
MAYQSEWTDDAWKNFDFIRNNNIIKNKSNQNLVKLDRIELKKNQILGEDGAELETSVPSRRDDGAESEETSTSGRLRQRHVLEMMAARGQGDNGVRRWGRAW